MDASERLLFESKKTDGQNTQFHHTSEYAKSRKTNDSLQIDTVGSLNDYDGDDY